MILTFHWDKFNYFPSRSEESLLPKHDLVLSHNSLSLECVEQDQTPAMKETSWDREMVEFCGSLDFRPAWTRSISNISKIRDAFLPEADTAYRLLSVQL